MVHFKIPRYVQLLNKLPTNAAIDARTPFGGYVMFGTFADGVPKDAT
jgi:hypothetical protein